MEVNLDQTEVINIIIETINALFNNLFSSIDNHIYANLDTFTFINNDILKNSIFEKLLGANGKTGTLYLSDALLLGIIIYYAIRYSYSSFSGSNVEKPTQFVFKMIILGILINSSYFISDQLLQLNFLISSSIQEIGEGIIGKQISFSNLIKELNSVISIGSNSFDLFSFDGIIKGFISVGLLNLLFSYSLRYVMVQVFVILTPLIFLSLMNSSTYWIFKSWFKAFLALLLLQSFISIILIVMLSFSTSNKILLIGAIYSLIRANTYMKEIFGGINIEVSNNISSFASSLKS